MCFGAVVNAAYVSFGFHAYGGNIGKDVHISGIFELAAATVNGLIDPVPWFFSCHTLRTKISCECCKLIMEKMISISADELGKMERFYRANLINCLSGFKPVSLVGTVDKEGRANLAVFSNIVHLGADPALVGFINRPRAAAPHTLSNIESTGMYTINHIHPSFVSQAHQTSAKYPEGCSEFEATGLEPEFLEGLSAPFVKASPVKFALQLEEVHPLTINGTFLVIGSVKWIYLQEGLLEEDGFLSLDRASTVCSLGLDGYCSSGPIVRYPYAKP